MVVGFTHTYLISAYQH